VHAKRITTLGLVVLLAVLVAVGCGRDNLTNPAQAPKDPIVFDDTFGNAVDYQAFMGSKTDAVQIDATTAYEGDASLVVTVPGPGSTEGTFAGGAFTTYNARDLSSYNALTFYAKSSINSTLDIVGIANDNTGTSLYQSSREAIPLSTDWTRVVIPIPNPSKLTNEGGLFWFAEGYEDNQGFEVWFDEVIFETVDTISNPRPVMDTKTVSVLEGGEAEITGTQVTFDVGREDVVVDCFPACFDYVSSDETVAIVEDGTIQAVGGGTAVISALLDTVDVDGDVTVEVIGSPDGAAPVPTVPEADVISLFSEVYDDEPVASWRTDWSSGTVSVADFQVEGDSTKLYTNSPFQFWYAGIELASVIDVATPGMTHFHVDLWAPSGGSFKIKLVDFGEDGEFGGAPDSEGELMFTGGTTPPFVSGEWSSLDIPLADFAGAGLLSSEHFAQIVISSSDVMTVVVDNVYFHR